MGSRADAHYGLESMVLSRLEEILRPPRLTTSYERSRLTERSMNVLKAIAETIDDVLEGLVGDRPVEDLLKTAAHLSPAVVWKRATGLPAPGEIVRAIRQNIMKSIEDLEARLFPGAHEAKELEREILG